MKTIPTLKNQSCCCSAPQDIKTVENYPAWRRRYLLLAPLALLLWGALYLAIKPLADWLSYDLFAFARDSHFGAALAFFLYDTVKILLLLLLLIYGIALFRVSLNIERVRSFLAGKGRVAGYGLGALFGAITPFCSCSSIPLFLAFTVSRIPMGSAMAFLITSPLINEIAIVLLWGLLGWKFTLIYVSVGLLAGMLGGWFMDSIKAERWLRPFLRESLEKGQEQRSTPTAAQGQETKMNLRRRHLFAAAETLMIFRRVWMWVLIGVGIGAALHGYVPEDWFAKHFSAQEWWSVPLAVVAAIPLYTNVTGIIPIMESLLLKGLPIGTTMAFCMSSVAASLPEVMMLRQIMEWKLQALFIAYLCLLFTLIGYLLNLAGPYIL